MKLSNEEIAKVVSMYAPCQGVHYFSKGKSAKINIGYSLIQHIPLLGFDDYKLLLTPLSEITDEHAVEVGKMVMPFDEAKAHSDYFMKIGKSWVKEDSNTMFDLQYDVYLYLISCGYAVPLFFAPDHWANGKTPLDLGIAISKNEVK